MKFTLEPIDAAQLELERQKKSQRRINILLLLIDVALLGLVVYEIVVRFSQSV